MFLYVCEINAQLKPIVIFFAMRFINFDFTYMAFEILNSSSMFVHI